MSHIETYWAIANHTISIINILVECWLYYRFVKPFVKEKAQYVGLSYSAAMLVFYCVPQEINYPYFFAILIACITMCLLERRNIKQKKEYY